METITFKCRFITPAFLGGADPKGTPELRPPSIKGALRWWWRAIHGDLSLEALQKKEVELFGGSFKESGKEVFMRSKVLVRVEATDERISKGLDGSMAFRYMAYGAEDRAFFDVDTQFEVHFSITEKDPQKIEDIKKQVLTAFSLLSNFGGLGAKSRNGFGSFHCSDITPISTLIALEPIHTDDFTPKFTALSGRTQIYQTTKSYSDYVPLIKALANIYKEHGRRSVHKSKRQYVGAPYANVAVPERHAKIHLMSVVSTRSGLKGLITFMPYDYMRGHPDFSEEHQQIWTEVVFDTFNHAIYDAEFRGNPLVETLIND